MNYLKLGTIIKTRGLKGTLKVYSTSDFSAERYQKGEHVFLRSPEGNITECIVDSYIYDKGFDYITLQGYTSIEQVTPLIKCEVLIDKDSHPLEDGFYYLDDLRKCDIYENDVLIGKVKEVEDYNGNRSLRIVYNNKKEFLLPFVDAFIKNVDIENKRIDVLLIEGMK